MKNVENRGMTKLRFLTKPHGLQPFDEQTSRVVEKWGQDTYVTGEFQRPRNPLFHAKFFALLNVLYEIWEPEEVVYGSVPAVKNFDRFRHDMIIASGYYDVVINLKGEARAEPKSMSFSSMDEDEFEKLYSKIIDIGLGHIAKHYTKEDLDEQVDRILGFA
jgi:hypothetical protein